MGGQKNSPRRVVPNFRHGFSVAKKKNHPLAASASLAKVKGKNHELTTLLLIVVELRSDKSGSLLISGTWETL